MNITDFPVEILDLILDFYLPYHWNNSDGGIRSLNTRLVCRLFNLILSRRAFRKLDFDHLVQMAQSLKEPAVEWLMFRRLAVEGKLDSHGGVITSTEVVDDSRKSFTSYNKGVVIHKGQDYIRMACLVAITYHGRTAICQWLANSSARDSLHRLLSTSEASVTAFHKNTACMVPLLLSPGYDINASDEWLGPPMYAAAYNEDLGVTRTLLEYGADPNVQGYSGTPLLVALWTKNNGLLRLLCQCDRVNPNIPDKKGETALWWACFLGFSDAVEILLGHKDTDPNIRGNGQSPLTAAAGGGHDAAVRLLLERDDLITDINGPVTCPLWWAVYRGHVSTLRLLLERLPVSPDEYGLNSISLLWWAARYGQDSIVQMLLERQDVDPNRHYRHLNTPLWHAVDHGHVQAVWYLLQRQDLKPNIRSYIGDTPLTTAVSNGNEPMVQLLLTCPGVSPNRKSLPYMSPPLTIAASKGQTSMVDMLLEREDIRVNSADVHNRSAVWFAAKEGHEDMVRLLLERDDVRLDLQDSTGRTPLLWACRNGHNNIVRLLLGRERSVIDVPDYNGYTCLIQAVVFNQVSVIRTLLEFNADCRLTDVNNQSALSWAQGMQNDEVEELLLQHRGNPG